MSGLFVFYIARGKDGQLRHNNAVFSECGPLVAMDDIADLQRVLEEKFDYEPDTLRIQNWQRMEVPNPTQIEGEKP